MMDMERKERTKKAIAAAFADVPYPGDEGIALDPTTFPGSDIRREFKGNHWRDMLLKGAACWVAFLLPEARRFYLPAFLLGALDRLPQGYESVDLFDLVPPEDGARFAREYDAYTPAQRDAIRLFLECVRDEAKDRITVTLARLALKRYWGKEWEWSKARFAVFHPAERRAIRLFLEYVRDEMNDENLARHARRALDQYWATNP